MKISNQRMQLAISSSLAVLLGVEGFVARPFSSIIGIVRTPPSLKVAANPLAGYQPVSQVKKPSPFGGYEPSPNEAPKKNYSPFGTKHMSTKKNYLPFGAKHKSSPPQDAPKGVSLVKQESSAPQTEATQKQAAPAESNTQISSSPASQTQSVQLSASPVHQEEFPPIKSEPTDEFMKLQGEYERLKKSSWSIQIELQSEIVDIKEELRKQASFLNYQVDQLKRQLQTSELEWDRAIREFKAVAEATESKLKQKNADIAAQRDDLLEQVKILEETKRYVAFADKRDAELRQLIAALTQERDGFRTKIEVLEETENLLLASRAREAQLTKEIQEISNARDEALMQAKDLQSVLEATRADFRKVNDAIIQERNEFRAQLGVLQETRELLAQAKQREANLQQQLQQQRMDSTQETTQLQATIDKTRAEFHQVNNAIIKERKEYQGKIMELQETNAHLALAQKRGAETRKELQGQLDHSEKIIGVLEVAVIKREALIARLNDEIEQERTGVQTQVKALHATNDLLSHSKQREADLREDLETIARERNSYLKSFLGSMPKKTPVHFQ